MIRSTSSGGGSDKQGRVYADHLVDGVVEVEHDWRQGQPASVEHDGTGPTNFLDPKRDGHFDVTGRRQVGSARSAKSACRAVRMFLKPLLLVAPERPQVRD